MAGLNHWKAERISTRRSSTECRYWICAFSCVRMDAWGDAQSCLDRTMYFIQLNGPTSRFVMMILHPSSSCTHSPCRIMRRTDRIDTNSRASTKTTPTKNRMDKAIGHQAPDAVPAIPAIDETSSGICCDAISIGLWMVMTHIGSRKLTSIIPTRTTRFSRWKDSLFSRSR